MRIVGLIGHPVGHSFSPAMHNAAFEHLGIDLEYRAWDVPPGRFAQEMNEKIRLLPGWLGANVTIPHKVAARDYADLLTPEAELIGAVNTLVLREDGRLLGDNTDGRGFLRALAEDLHFSPRDKRVLLLGAGGGSLAVAVSLAREGMSELIITDLDRAKAAELAGRMRERFPSITVRFLDEKESADDLLSSSRIDLLVNATPVGMREGDPLLVSPENLRRGAENGLVVYDLVYNRLTELIKHAREAGLKAGTGLSMLLYQGCIAQEQWTGLPAPVEVMRQVLLERLNP